PRGRGRGLRPGGRPARPRPWGRRAHRVGGPGRAGGADGAARCCPGLAVARTQKGALSMLEDLPGGSAPALCVFCGAKNGTDPRWMALARDFGAAIAARGWVLVFGGGRVGLMGALADG